MDSHLPDFVKPMLASSGEPFSSPEFLFELKWDGFRAVALRDTDSFRLRSRNNLDLARKFPELALTRVFEPGMVVDGEIVAMDGERPDFDLLIGERGDAAIAYVVFDLLYLDYEPVIDEPLTDRRARLREIVGAVRHPQLLYSDDVRGDGLGLYEQASEHELEGIMAKRAASRYYPGRRSDNWIKIKRVQRLFCVIIGFFPKGTRDFKSILVASNMGGEELRYVGNVGSGFTDREREELRARLTTIVRDTPVVACDQAATWVEPSIFCSVKFSEVTAQGMLRAPVFVELAT